MKSVGDAALCVIKSMSGVVKALGVNSWHQGEKEEKKNQLKIYDKANVNMSLLNFQGKNETSLWNVALSKG